MNKPTVNANVVLKKKKIGKKERKIKIWRLDGKSVLSAKKLPTSRINRPIKRRLEENFDQWGRATGGRDNSASKKFRRPKNILNLYGRFGHFIIHRRICFRSMASSFRESSITSPAERSVTKNISRLMKLLHVVFLIDMIKICFLISNKAKSQVSLSLR